MSTTEVTAEGAASGDGEEDEPLDDPVADGTGVTVDPAVGHAERRLLVLKWVRRAAIAIWAAVLAFCVWRFGIPFDRESLMAWIAAGLIAASIGRRPLLTVVIDWIPFAIVLLVYDFARGASQKVDGHTLWTPQVDFDKWLFWGNEPTAWLQQHLMDTTVRWWDVALTGVYVSFFLLPYVVAGIFWLRSRREFHQWVGRFVVMSFLGVLGFVFFPAAPPWAAARCTAGEVANHPVNPLCINADPALVPGGGLLGRFTPIHAGAADYVQRTSGRGFSGLHLSVAQTMLDKGQATVDLVAAVPSLHAGITLLFAIFIWRRTRWYLRPLLVVYVLVMALALVYFAEHYVFDIVIGWALAILVSLVFGWFERRRSRAQRPDTLEVSLPNDRPASTPMETQCPPIETTPSST